MLTFVFTLLFILPIGILDAYVIRDMWLWFAVPALAVNPITVLLSLISLIRVSS